MDRAGRAVLGAHVGIVGGLFDRGLAVNLGLHAIGELRASAEKQRAQQFPAGHD